MKHKKIYVSEVCKIDRLNPDGSVYSTEPFDSKDFTSLTKAKSWCKKHMKNKNFYVAWIETFDEDGDVETQYHLYKDDIQWGKTVNT